MTRPWDDPRFAQGLRAQLAQRMEELAAGSSHLGWKAGFGSPPALERLSTEGSLVGYLLHENTVPSGGTVSVARWTKAVLEPEIAVHLSGDLPGGAGEEAAREAIGALGAAFELADIDFPPDDPEAILAANVYQRSVVLGPPRAGASLDGVEAAVFRGGDEVARTSDPEEMTGSIVELVSYLADLLDAFGERLRAGDVIIAGTVVPALEVADGGEIHFELGPLGSVDVTIAP
jgi:2-oxo-hept-3-ene-1,7-dioate hydratase